MVAFVFLLKQIKRCLKRYFSDSDKACGMKFWLKENFFLAKNSHPFTCQ